MLCCVFKFIGSDNAQCGGSVAWHALLATGSHGLGASGDSRSTHASPVHNDCLGNWCQDQSHTRGGGGGFKAGQILVIFDCSLQQAQLEKAKAELESAEQTYKANQRMVELNAIGQLELDLSRSAVNRAKAEVSGNQAVLGKCHVTAPFAGRVAEQKAREQQFVQAGQPMLDILDDSVLELEFLVPSAWLHWLRVGGSFDVQIDETRKTYPARFTRIGARVDPVSQSVKVAAAIHGKFPELMTGMSGRVLIKSSEGQ